jgi:hypothetical protein
VPGSAQYPPLQHEGADGITAMAMLQCSSETHRGRELSRQRVDRESVRDSRTSPSTTERIGISDSRADPQDHCQALHNERHRAHFQGCGHPVADELQDVPCGRSVNRSESVCRLTSCALLGAPS